MPKTEPISVNVWVARDTRKTSGQITVFLDEPRFDSVAGMFYGTDFASVYSPQAARRIMGMCETIERGTVEEMRMVFSLLERNNDRKKT